jgi:hypothetical protein
MGLDLTDLSEVRTLSVPHPSQAPLLEGRSFVTPWFTMDAERSASFEHSSYMDQFPHPYVGEAAYGEGLVEGFHLLCMLDYLCNTALWSEGPWLAWNYGLDRVRFVTVIRRQDPFRLRGQIREVIDRGPQGHLLVLELTGEVKGRQQPGFVATLRFLWTVAAPSTSTTKESRDHD